WIDGARVPVPFLCSRLFSNAKQRGGTGTSKFFGKRVRRRYGCGFLGHCLIGHKVANTLHPLSLISYPSSLAPPTSAGGPSAATAALSHPTMGGKPFRS